MEIFDLTQLTAEGYENRSVNVFYQNDLLKTRVIVLAPSGAIPACRMESYVLFYVVRGKVLIQKNGESFQHKEGQVMIFEPVLISMETQTGARLMGVQISAQNGK